MILFVSHSFAVESCNCKTYTEETLAYYKEGDFKAYLTAEAIMYAQLVKDRITICQFFVNYEETPKTKKVKLEGIISDLKKVSQEIERQSGQLKTAKITSAKDFKAMQHRIQGRSGEVLQTSTDIFRGKQEDDSKEFFLGGIFRKGNCRKGESPPNHDCAGLASGINKDCNDAIRTKMECGYYNDYGSVEEAQAELENDQQNCIRMAENQQQMCQMANYNCNNNYNPWQDMFAMDRQAQMACSLRDNFERPSETQTSEGN